MLKEFREFILRGNLVDLAVAVVIGTAFTAVVTAFVTNIVTPIIAAIGGKPDFSDLTFTINGSEFCYGAFINALIAFLDHRRGRVLLRHQAGQPAHGALSARHAGRRRDAGLPGVPERHPDRRDALRVLHRARCRPPPRRAAGPRPQPGVARV